MTDYEFPFQKMDAYVVAKELAVTVHAVKIEHAELRDQATRAATSAFLQLSEGLPNDSVAMRRRYFVISRNSLSEVAAAIDLAQALGAIPQDRASMISALAVRLRGMLIALMRESLTEARRRESRRAAPRARRSRVPDRARMRIFRDTLSSRK